MATGTPFERFLQEGDYPSLDLLNLDDPDPELIETVRELVRERGAYRHLEELGGALAAAVAEAVAEGELDVDGLDLEQERGVAAGLREAYRRATLEDASKGG